MRKLMLVLGFLGAVSPSYLYIGQAPAQASNMPFTICSGKGTNYLYVVPTNMIQAARANLRGCNVGGGIGWPSLPKAISVACDRMARITGESAANWPQTWQPDFGITITC